MKLKKESAVGIKWRIFAGFASFAAITLALLWLFQVVLLDDFYKTIKVAEIKSTANTICKNIGSETLDKELFNIAVSNQLCIVISTKNGSVLYVQNTLSGSSAVDRSPIIWAANYAVAQQNGGTFFQRFYEKPGFGAVEAPQKGTGDSIDLPESMIYVKMAKAEDGKDPLMVMVNAVISPVGATVQTLRLQLWCITGVMLVLALVLALYLARSVSRPIEKLNASAKLLAAGNYEAPFMASGYKEIEELGASLTYAAQELRKVETLQRDLIANISHDLRTPLTLVTGYAEVMRDLPGENTPENVQIIIDEATRLTSLVNDVLDISKLQSGTLALQKSEYNLTESVRQMLNRYSKLTDYNIRFFADENICVYADELKISQVVYNLVNNAITYTGEDKTVTLRQTAANGRVRISVTDTGEGIPREKLGDIWERYYKVDKAHKRAQIGTGLGLSIVRTILDLHGGAYGVDSRENVGSTFWFELVIAEPEK